MEQQIVQLQRRVRRLELVLLASLAGCSAVVLGSADRIAPETVRAPRFEMLDEAGRVRGYWRVTDDGSSALTLYDAAGQARVALAASPSGASEIAVLTPTGANRRLRIEADGSAPVVPATGAR
jgi:hypothetical protein